MCYVCMSMCGQSGLPSCTCATYFEFHSPRCQDDPEDLHFRKGDVMWVLRKDEDEWWFARHSDGREGSIPVPYVTVVSLGKLGGRREGGREGGDREGERRR